MDVTFHPFTIKENEMSGKDGEKRSEDSYFCLHYFILTVNSIILVRCLSLSASFSHQLSSIVSCLRYGYWCETVLVFEHPIFRESREKWEKRVRKIQTGRQNELSKSGFGKERWRQREPFSHQSSITSLLTSTYSKSDKQVNIWGHQSQMSEIWNGWLKKGLISLSLHSISFSSFW